MVNQNLERRLKDGRSHSINLPYEKTRIEGDIGLVERNIEKAKATQVSEKKGHEKDKTIKIFQAKLAYLHRLKNLIDKAIHEQKQKNMNAVDLADGQKRTIEDLEAELATREWL